VNTEQQRFKILVVSADWNIVVPQRIMHCSHPWLPAIADN